MSRVKTIRLLARISGILSSLLAAYFIIFTGLSPENKGNEQIITINVMMVFLVFGFLIGWYREREGGIILSFGSIIAYLYFSYLPRDQFPLFWIYSTVFLVPGFLLLYADFLNRKKKS